jgi:glycosyltransferase involved in cell wall biosynthesis
MEVAESANILFATSDKILERLEDVGTPKFKINHGVAQHFFEENNELFKQGETPDRIKIGYIGNLLYKYLDVEILGTIIDNNKDVLFTFIGPYEQSNLHGADHNLKFIEYLKYSKNVHMLGPKPSNELPCYLNQFDLFLMCYTGDRNVAEMANPHKILEYLSTGKTIVSHYIDEYKDKIDLVEMVNDNRLLPQRLKHVIHNLHNFNSPEKVQLRRQYALSNTYEKQIERIELLVRSQKLLN